MSIKTHLYVYAGCYLRLDNLNTIMQFGSGGQSNHISYLSKSIITPKKFALLQVLLFKTTPWFLIAWAQLSEVAFV